MKNYIEISMKNNTNLYIEAIDLNSAYEDITVPATSSTKFINKSIEYVEDSISQIKEFASTLSNSIRSLDVCPDEFEVGFSVGFSADANVIISSVSADAGMTVKLKWKR